MVNVLIKNVDETAYKAAKMLAVKPVDFGKGTENLSREIDKILYE